ncbi:MAG: response regulator, partial [Acidimicrobiia bacterium]|nr:response regulator [Acidimicrobiia bacterium]
MTSKRRRILLLDDDRDLLQLLVAYLKGPLVDLVVCSEIEAAECLLDREHFDVLVTDLELSALGGLEGIRLVRHVTCNFPNTDVVVFSGYINDEVRELGRALGVLELLDKPHGLFRLRKILGGENWPDKGRSDDESGSVRQVETLESVLSSRCITAVLQPIVALAPVRPGEWLHGVEGLSRGPEGSPLRNPDVFLDLASRKERLFETELQCFEAVLVERRSLPGSHGLFLNTRPRSMSMPDFSAQLCELVHRYGYKPCDVVLELTEQQSVLNSEAFEATLGALRTRGFRLALD